MAVLATAVTQHSIPVPELKKLGLSFSNRTANCWWPAFTRTTPDAPRYLAVRFSSAGQADLSFGVGGLAELDIIGKAAGLALQGDGKIVVAGSHTYTSLSNFPVVRLLPDGTPDPSFAIDGVATISLDVSSAACGAMALQSDGRIVLAGHIENGGNTDVVLLRLHTDGSLDPTFGDGGRVCLPLMPYNQIFAIQIQPDGKILTGGSAGVPEVSDWLLLRLLPDGSPGPTFSQDGIVITSISGAFFPNPCRDVLAIRALDGRRHPCRFAFWTSTGEDCWKKRWMVAQPCSRGICRPVYTGCKLRRIRVVAGGRGW